MMVSIDKVMPAHVADYEKAVKNFNTKHKDAKVKSVNWWGNEQENYTYVYGVPIENMASLDKPYWGESAQKLSAPVLKSLFNEMDKHIVNHELLIYNHIADLSYTHESMANTENNYREWTSYHFKIGTGEEVRKIAEAYKKLYASNNLTADFRIYKCVFGDGDHWVVQHNAKDAKHLVDIRTKANKLFAEKGQDLRKQLEAILVSTDTKEGRFRPDLSYMPASENAPVSTMSDDK
jgi:hypothetical protein